MTDATKQLAAGTLSRCHVIVAAGAAAVAVYLPFADRAVAAPAAGATQREDLSPDWSIDDQWGVFPRYDAIPCAPHQSDDARLAPVHPADLAFLA